MTNKTLSLSAFVLIAGSLCQAQPAPEQAPFACNLKAFTPAERIRWRKLIEHVSSAVVVARELNDGYALRVNASQASLGEVAEWVDLERKCCPFFDFQVDVHGQDGSMWLSLKGREGVKDFIRMDFSLLREKLSKAEGTK